MKCPRCSRVWPDMSEQSVAIKKRGKCVCCLVDLKEPFNMEPYEFTCHAEIRDEAKAIEVAAHVRYWEDATFGGLKDTDGTRIPFRKGDCWCPIICLEDGAIEDWPSGFTAEIHYKVCDEGEYWLLDAGLKRIAEWAGDYVPDRFLCHGDNGYGDYIILSVGADGKIVGWVKPAIKEDEWQPAI